MLRVAILLAVLLLPPIEALAQNAPPGFKLTRSMSVKGARVKDHPAIRTRIEGRAGRFYGGMRGHSQARDAISHNVDVYVGVQPRFGMVALDLGYTRPMADGRRGTLGNVKLSMRRSFGDRGSLRAELRVDPATATARTEAAARVRILHDLRVVGSVSSNLGASGAAPNVAWNLGVGRVFADVLAVGLRYSDTEHSAPRTALTMAIRF